jgi:cellulose synthase/poly-beta-1,6-N-acetylglucosamine synthase-like glycosyltransferase
VTVTEIGGGLIDFATLLDTPFSRAVAPALFAGAALFTILLWVPPGSRIMRVLLAAVSVALMGRYVLWRYGHTLPPSSEPLNWIAGWTFALIESIALASAAVSMLFLSRVRDRSAESDAHASWIRRRDRPPLVDVLICTFNEEQRIVERTILGAMGMDYARFRTWVLDDGNRPWLRDLCEKLGCGYIARSDHSHAKAGNINNALNVLARLPEPPEFISILDADFVPTAAFLTRALPLFHDPAVGIVQTPQHFINPDPIQTNLALTGLWPDEQRYFFDIVMPAKDAWGCAFCCGTSSLIRFDALRKLGGLPTDSVTEDYLLTLRLKEIGYSTVYLNEPLSFGLAPEGLKEYVTQRGRWCLGFMQIVRGPSGPFSLRRRIGFIQRLSLLEAFTNWSFAYMYKVGGILVPILYLLCGVKAVQVSLVDMLAYFLPYFVVQSLTMSWISQGRVVPIMTDVCQLLTAPPALKAVAIGLLRPRGHKFSVTAKGGDRQKRFVEWPLLRIFLTLLLLADTSVVFAFAFSGRHVPIDEGALALVWSWYNIAALTLLCFICVEQPRRRRAGRFATQEKAAIYGNGGQQLFWMRDISASGARFGGKPPVGKGESLLIRIGNAYLHATVVRASDRDFAVRFENSSRARGTLIKHIYSAMHERVIRQVRIAPIARALLLRVMK